MRSLLNLVFLSSIVFCLPNGQPTPCESTPSTATSIPETVVPDSVVSSKSKYDHHYGNTTLVPDLPTTSSSFPSTTPDTSEAPCPCATETDEDPSPTPNAWETPKKLALKRDWRLDAGAYTNLKAEKYCKMMYTDGSVQMGNST